MNTQLIQCTYCLAGGTKQYLGRILENGDLDIRRFHHGTTIIRAANYEIICGCGNRFNVEGTVVTNYL